jgi:hypothetical protein
MYLKKKILKDVLKKFSKNSLKILKIKQWSKGACVVFNNVVGLNDIILLKFSNDILDIHVILSSIMDVI